MNVVYVTGNAGKAANMARYLGIELEHQPVELEEIQSLDLQAIVDRKARFAFRKLKRPVIVDDVSVELAHLGRLPGPLIRWFIDEIGTEGICRLIDGKDRAATVRCAVAYFDGERMEILEGVVSGQISERPTGSRGFGWDTIFIPEGFTSPRAEHDEDEYGQIYRQTHSIDRLRALLERMG